MNDNMSQKIWGSAGNFLIPPIKALVLEEEEIKKEQCEALSFKKLKAALKRQVLPIHCLEGLKSLELSQEELDILESKIAEIKREEIINYIQEFIKNSLFLPMITDSVEVDKKPECEAGSRYKRFYELAAQRKISLDSIEHFLRTTPKEELDNNYEILKMIETDKEAADHVEFEINLHKGVKHKAEDAPEDEPFAKRIRLNEDMRDLCLTKGNFRELGKIKKIPHELMESFLDIIDLQDPASCYTILEISDEETALNFIKNRVGDKSDSHVPINLVDMLASTESVFREYNLMPEEINYCINLVRELWQQGIAHEKINDFNHIIALLVTKLYDEDSLSLHEAGPLCSQLIIFGASRDCLTNFRKKLDEKRSDVISHIKKMMSQPDGMQHAIHNILALDFGTNNSGLEKKTFEEPMELVVGEAQKTKLKNMFISLAQQRNIPIELLDAYVHILDPNDIHNQYTVISLFDDNAEALEYIRNSLRQFSESAMSERLSMAASCFVAKDFSAHDVEYLIYLMSDLFESDIFIKKIDLFCQIILAYAAVDIPVAQFRITTRQAAQFCSSFIKNGATTGQLVSHLEDLKSQGIKVVVIVKSYITKYYDDPAVAAKWMLADMAKIDAQNQGAL
jgi:hypothetical protein